MVQQQRHHHAGVMGVRCCHLLGPARRGGMGTVDDVHAPGGHRGHQVRCLGGRRPQQPGERRSEHVGRRRRRRRHGPGARRARPTRRRRASASISSRVASRSRNPHLASNGVSAQISSGLWLASRYTRVGASSGMPRSFSRSKPHAGLLERRMRLDRQRSSRRQDLHQERQRAEPVGDLAAERCRRGRRDHLIERAAGRPRPRWAHRDGHPSTARPRVCRRGRVPGVGR